MPRVPRVEHPPVDEYLEAIFGLEDEGVRVIQARLAHRGGISAPSVSEMVRRLQTSGYLKVGPDRTLRLTCSSTVGDGGFEPSTSAV